MWGNRIRDTWREGAGMPPSPSSASLSSNSTSVDHNVADYDPSLFPVDPNAMEMAALAQAPNLSPCTGGAYWCTDWDMTPANATAGTPDGHAKVIMDSIGWPDFLIEGARPSTAVFLL